ncbi:adenylate/guanylate cyclase domain-containing protein [Microvirga sp. 17 mud 1-3]|uniref:adenylate/guanylate cyclase domain-containing protein n=1 Tax=Microvirga sp. 17 mud 1-3 TaxID=2082949 RepID=UPI000D6CE873|nr:adenylate/guanylate cyclase domain-containing protein [Microvirga sp. 17 mud 1-3]AWM89072.1 adenylate/guanylate cyclase domain-containing protein [Microvirga sp. 17 mud 1-3]
MQPETRYARSGDLHIAYQVFGAGSVDLVLVPGFISNVEETWDNPSAARWLERLGRFARVITFDKRGTGLSDRAGSVPTLDERMDDARAVMDAAYSERAVLLGISEGGALAILFAASHPDRCSSLILYGAFATFSGWYPTEKKLAAFYRYVEEKWGTGESVWKYAPSMANDAGFKKIWARHERVGATPAAAKALMRMNQEIDISGVLNAIRVPTLVIHRTEDIAVGIEDGRFLAQHIPHARLAEFAGTDHLPYIGENADDIANEIQEFVTGSRAAVEVDRVLATVLLTDIVGSTKRASDLGDRRWRTLLDQHDNLVRQEISRFRGQEVKSLGDGFLATFDGPARAVWCAAAIIGVAHSLGLQIRCGLHTGEIELKGQDIAGIAVHIAARIAAQAQGGQVLVSRTVRDLVAGSGLRFVDEGTRSLKGLSDKARVFSVAV